MWPARYSGRFERIRLAVSTSWLATRRSGPLEQLAVNRVIRRFEQQLIEAKIKPLSEFEPGVSDRSSMFKPEPRM